MKRALLTISLAAGLACAVSAHAGVVAFVGADDGVSSRAQMTNAVAASNAFDAAAGATTLVDFESGLHPGVSFSAGDITDTSFCNSPVCGINTTVGGANFLSLLGGSITFTFASVIDAFGIFVTGLQTDTVLGQTLTFDDGSSQTILTPSSVGGGGAFLGFTDFGKRVRSVTYVAEHPIEGGSRGDVVGFDDLRFSTVAGAPEPATWAMLLIGFGGLGAMARRRRALSAFG